MTQFWPMRPEGKPSEGSSERFSCPVKLEMHREKCLLYFFGLDIIFVNVMLRVVVAFAPSGESL